MKKLRLGMVGLRFGQHIIDKHIVKGGGQPYLELAGVCDLDAQKAQAVASLHGVAVDASLDAMIARPDIDVVGLFTPPNGRAELVRKAIRGGKHVITTKPFEMDPQAALAVLLEAKRLGRVVHLNSPSPLCSPEIAQIIRWQQQYELGAAVAGQAETWASYREQDDGSWFCDPKKCPAAPILRIGIYCINDLVRLFGPANSVQVMHQHLRSGRPTSDNAQMLIGFGNGIVGSVFASFCIEDGNPYPNALRISYERGTVYCNVGAPGEDRSLIHLQLVMGQGKAATVAARAAFKREQCSSNYQWEALHRAVGGEVLQGEITPQEIAAGVAILAAMARADASGATELVADTGTASRVEGVERMPKQVAILE